MDFLLIGMLADAGVTASNLQRLQEALSHRSLAPGDTLLRQGDPAPDLYVVRQGLAKMHYITADGKEFVKSFLAEGAFAGSLIAQLEGGNSSFSVTCLEPTVVEWAPESAVEDLFERDPAALRFGFKFFQSLALRKERREHNFLCLPAEERYRLFIEESPALAQRLSQADIARYLGITPVALSRIRGRLKIV